MIVILMNIWCRQSLDRRREHRLRIVVRLHCVVLVRVGRLFRRLQLLSVALLALVILWLDLHDFLNGKKSVVWEREKKKVRLPKCYVCMMWCDG
jgi:hypothetical protein